jgi:uncharacterized protein
VPAGTSVDLHTLALVERAEEAVRRLGFRVFRVRHYGESARVEVAAAEMDAAVRERERLHEVVRDAGYRVVTLDPVPFRSGSLNVLR